MDADPFFAGDGDLQAAGELVAVADGIGHGIGGEHRLPMIAIGAGT